MESTQSQSKNSSKTNSNHTNTFSKINSQKFLEKEYLINEEDTKNLFENKYELIRKLGEGSHAKVYLGKKRNSKSHVAIKIIKIESLTSESKFSNLQNEIEIVKSLKKNPYTLELKDLMKDEENLYLVFSYVGSRNLAEYLAENKQLTVII